MADRPPYPDTSDDSGVKDNGSTVSTPRWVKVFVVAVVLLGLLFISLLVLGGGHRPGCHSPPGGPGGHTPSAGITEKGVQQSWP